MDDVSATPESSPGKGVARVENWTGGHASPSQMKTHARCRRKWFFQKIAKVPVDYTPKQLWNFRYGTETHTICEDYVNGVDVQEEHDLDAYQAAALPYLDQYRQRDDVETETRIRIPTPIVEVWGIVDLRPPEGIIDHKTTSSRKWAKVEGELRRDIQTHTYLFDHFKKYPDLQQGFLELNYIQKPPYHQGGGQRHKPSNWQVQAVVTREANQTFWTGHILPRLEQMAEDSEEATAWDVEPNYAACGDYGGCPFQELCHGGEPGVSIWAGVGETHTQKSRTDLLNDLTPTEEKDVGLSKAEILKKVAEKQAASEKAPEATTETPEATTETPEGPPLTDIYADHIDEHWGMLETVDILQDGRIADLLGFAKTVYNAGGDPSDVLKAMVQADKKAFIAWRKDQEPHSNVQPPDARDNHPPGANLDDNGDVITDLEAADLPGQLHTGLTEDYGCTTLADVARLTKDQVLDIYGVGPGKVSTLEEVLAEAGYSLSEEAPGGKDQSTQQDGEQDGDATVDTGPDDGGPDAGSDQDQQKPVDVAPRVPRYKTKTLTDSPKGAGGDGDGLVVLVGCDVIAQPDRQVRSLAEVLKPIQARVVEKYNAQAETSGASPVQHYLEIGYNDGPKLVAAEFAQSAILDSSGYLVVDPYSPCGPACLEVLRQFTDATVIRAVK